MELNTAQIGVDVRTRNWTMKILGPNLEFIKNTGSKIQPQFTSVYLRRIPGKNHQFEAEFPKFHFVSKTAFFSAKDEIEIHLKRARTVIVSTFYMLKKAGLAPFIVNWDKFVVVNKFNKNINVDLALAELKRMQTIKSKN
jgi:hypothetical protein